MKFFIIDGMALLFRSYYAMMSMPLTSKDGEPTGATFGFISAILRILETEKPDAITVAWDSAEATFRHHQYEAYKANRIEFPSEMIPQLERTKQILESLNIVSIVKPGVEADDIAGTLAKIAAKEGHIVYCVTQDKDFMQLVEESISIYKLGKLGSDVEIISYNEVEKKFGVTPDKVIDVLALIGDASDNIPGVKGVGEKTAIPLIQQYGSLENVYENIEEITKKSLKEKLIINRDMAFLSKELVTIKIDVTLNETIEDLKTNEPNLPKLIPIFKRLGFNSLISRLATKYPDVIEILKNLSSDSHSIDQTQTEISSTPKINTSINDTQHTYKTIKTSSEIDELVDYLQKSEYLCFDTETDSLDKNNMNVIGIAFSTKVGEGFYIPIALEFTIITSGAGTLFAKEESKFSDGLQLETVIEKLKPVFENDNIKKIAHNAKFDMLLLKRYGIEVSSLFFDTMIAGYILDSTQGIKMDTMSTKYLYYQPIPISDLIGIKGERSMKEVDLDIVSEYSCEDADITLQLFNVLLPELKKESLYTLAETYDFPLVQVLTKMESIGIKIDTSALSEISELLEKTAKNLESEIHDIAGKPFTISSPKQLAEVLFEDLKLPVNKKNKTGYSTDQFVLEELSEIHPLPEKILEYRQAVKLKNTYVDALPELINNRTGRLHTSYNQALVSTGRLSSNNPNLQNIPIRSKLGQEIRKAFIPGIPNAVLVSADYSQIELRIMAHVCGDEAMVTAFKNGEDIHSATAMKVFGVSKEEVTPNMRRKAKEVNFGIMYGIGAFGLGRRLKIPRSEASEIIKSYFDKFPGVHKYMTDTVESARTKGYVETLSGRRRKYDNINARNAASRAADERAAINMPIQGTASDIIRKAMIDLHFNLPEAFPNANMLLQVHDELIFEVPISESESLSNFVKDKMENAFSLGEVPIIVDTGFGSNWYEAHL